MGDGDAAGHVTLRPFHIDMDPLMIAGGVGECVDHRLVDDQPFAGGEFLADMIGEIVRIIDDEHDASIEGDLMGELVAVGDRDLREAEQLHEIEKGEKVG